MKRSIPLLVVVALLTCAAPATAKDYARMARNIIPSGQYGSVPVPPGADRQARMYDGLTPLFDRVRRRDLFRFFKSERLGAAGQGPLTPEPVPGRPGLTIKRDRFHVPHIRGRTVDDVTFGAGWVTAQDRELLLEQARFNTRVAAVDVPEIKAFDLIRDLKSFTPSEQTEREVAKQNGVLRRKGRKGRRLLHDIDVFVSGINAYYASRGKTYKRWTRNDIFSLNALKGQFLGEGGGGDVLSAQLLWSLQRRLGRRRGESVWNDLRQRQDPETSVSVDGRFRYARLPRRRRGNVIIQNDTFVPTVTASRSSSPPTPPSSSNILMVSRRRSTTRRPLFVGGPQIGYFYPGLTLEMDLRGPGIQVRGATSVPFPGYMLIGRGQDFAWTLTSAGGDIIDTYVETLCGGSGLKYEYKGRCRDMQRFDAGTLGGRRIVFYKTVHGPVFGYAKTAAGTNVALSRKRSSYGRDTLDQLFFQDLTRGRVRNVRQFFRAANQSPQTFNAFYADDRDIGMFTTGRFPIRPRGIDSGLPTDGRGRYEWRGVLPRRRHVQGVNPRSGVLTNWNNKPGRGWPASDNQFNYGSIHRDELLKRGLRKRRRHSLASVTGVMNAAATQDIRAVEFVPVLAAVLRRGTAPSGRAARMLQLLESWNERGGSRLDRDLDGNIDDPGAAVLDSVWKPLVDAAMSPVLGPLTDELDVTLHSRFAAPPMGQSSGWYQYLAKDLRRLLGRRVRGRLRNRYCGGGSLRRCTADLWAAMDATGARLAAQQGASPDAWRADARRERITFLPGLLSTTMRYTNRPSGIQQVISFKGHRKRRR